MSHVSDLSHVWHLPSPRHLSDSDLLLLLDGLQDRRWPRRRQCCRVLAGYVRGYRTQIDRQRDNVRLHAKWREQRMRSDQLPALRGRIHSRRGLSTCNRRTCSGARAEKLTLFAWC